MDIEIVSKKENPLLDRTELEVVARHEGAPTPKREEVRELVAAALKVKKEAVVVDHINTRFGQGESRSYVKVYSSKQQAMAVEREPILQRNKLVVKEAPEKKAVEPAAAEPATEEPAAEEPAPEEPEAKKEE